jgi:hypothetical protein
VSLLYLEARRNSTCPYPSNNYLTYIMSISYRHNITHFVEEGWLIRLGKHGLESLNFLSRNLYLVSCGPLENRDREKESKKGKEKRLLTMTEVSSFNVTGQPWQKLSRTLLTKFL